MTVSVSRVNHRPAGTTAAVHTPLPSWDIHVISSAHKRLPLLTQRQTYRCIALSDEKGHNRTSRRRPLNSAACHRLRD